MDTEYWLQGCNMALEGQGCIESVFPKHEDSTDSLLTSDGAERVIWKFSDICTLLVDMPDNVLTCKLLIDHVILAVWLEVIHGLDFR